MDFILFAKIRRRKGTNMDHPLSHQIRWPCTNVTNHLLLLLNVPMTSTPLHSRGWLCFGVHNADFFQILCPESTLAFDLGTIIKKKNIFMCKILLNLRRWKFLRSSCILRQLFRPSLTATQVGNFWFLYPLVLSK